jgi:hypothetical protein
MWRLQAGNTDDGLAELSTMLQQAQDANIYGSEAWVAACLADAYRWLMRFTDGIDVGRRSIGRVRDHGGSNVYQFALLVESTVDCLLLTGDVDAAEQLVAPYAFSDATNAGWPLHLARAELDLLAANFAEAIARAEQVDAMGYHLDEMHMGVAAVGATADVWQGRPRSGLQRIDRAWAIVRASPRAARAGRLLALAARAAADLADMDFGVDRGELAETFFERARQAECFVPHPARVLGSAYGTTFDAELARLRRVDPRACVEASSRHLGRARRSTPSRVRRLASRRMPAQRPAQAGRYRARGCLCVSGRPPTAERRDPSPGPTGPPGAAPSGCDAVGTGHVGRHRGGIHAA